MTSYDIALTVNGEHVNARVEARNRWSISCVTI